MIDVQLLVLSDLGRSGLKLSDELFSSVLTGSSIDVLSLLLSFFLCLYSVIESYPQKSPQLYEKTQIVYLSLCRSDGLRFPLLEPENTQRLLDGAHQVIAIREHVVVVSGQARVHKATDRRHLRPGARRRRLLEWRDYAVTELFLHLGDALLENGVRLDGLSGAVFVRAAVDDLHAAFLHWRPFALQTKQYNI